MLLVLSGARTKNSATSVSRSVTEENLSHLINLLHEPPSERQHCKEKQSMRFEIRQSGIQILIQLLTSCDHCEPT